jgi:hypothetical protein
MPELSMLRAMTPRTVALIPATLAALSLAACVSSDKIESTTGSGSSQGGAASSASAGADRSSGSESGSGEPSTGSGLSEPCARSANQTFCGGDLGGTAEHTSVYTCSGGSTVNAVGCESGCESGACRSSPTDPCGSAEAGSGIHCGGTLTKGDPGMLYKCLDGTTDSKKSCPKGCKVNPAGTFDACNPEGDPCSAQGGDGHYCGASLGIGDHTVLYQCQGKKTVIQTTCAAGCQVNPSGTPDVCKPAGSGQCCVKKPAGVILQPYSACGLGGSHHGIDHGTAVGTPIYAGIAGTVVGSATQLPNCFDNGCSKACSSAFNYVKIKADCGDAADPVKDLYVYYLHIDRLAPGIENGSHVEQEQLVAFSGSSGCSAGAHIHIEAVSVSEGEQGPLDTCASVDPKSRYCN